MNFSDFKRLLGAEPWNRDPEVLEARNSDPQFEEAAAEAEAFERKLQKAMRVSAPDDLLSGIHAISEGTPTRRGWMPLALAASLLVAVGASGLAWMQYNRYESVQSYLAEHYRHDGHKVLASAAEATIDPAEVQRVMAKLDATAGAAFSDQIQYIKFCPTPDGRGAHMVVMTDDGPVTVIYMPETEVTDGEQMDIDGVQAYFVSLARGSAAVIGSGGQPTENLKSTLRESIQPLNAKA